MLQVAQPDDIIILWNYKRHSNLHGPINRTDNVGLDLRIPAGSRVSRTCSFAPQRPEALTDPDDSKAILDRAV